MALNVNIELAAQLKVLTGTEVRRSQEKGQELYHSERTGDRPFAAPQ